MFKPLHVYRSELPYNSMHPEHGLLAHGHTHTHTHMRGANTQLLRYIAQEGEYGALTCKHGPDECAADGIQL